DRRGVWRAVGRHGGLAYPLLERAELLIQQRAGFSDFRLQGVLLGLQGFELFEQVVDVGVLGRGGLYGHGAAALGGTRTRRVLLRGSLATARGCLHGTVGGLTAGLARDGRLLLAARGCLRILCRLAARGGRLGALGKGGNGEECDDAPDAAEQIDSLHS